MADKVRKTYQIRFISVLVDRLCRKVYYQDNELLVRKLLKAADDGGIVNESVSIRGITYCDRNNSEDWIEICPSEFVEDKKRALRFERVVTDTPLECLT